ncbi:MAG: flavodoxin [Lachnospiraceae bacterium]|nr:flavodoxin [Lachnospiraceae bacterium]
MEKTLIAYYSRAGENYVNGMLKQLEKGNTETAAELLHELTGAEMFRIEQMQAYSKDYNVCIAQAKEDQRRDARPELKSYPQNLDDYEIIYIGYPNYWNTMPMAVFTFLERFDFAGKILRPFCTHEGSGMGSSERDIKRLCPKAVVEKGLAIRGSSAERSKKELERWILGGKKNG